MEPTTKIEPQPWMTAEETHRVVAALTAEGAVVRFVGGCVRDSLVGRPVKDVDIATHDPPERVMSLLKAADIRAIPTGIEHGTVTAVIGGAHFEITTLREDVETFGRRAKVAFTDDWTADASRRDFTFNAIFCAPDGTVFDPFGGIEDLKAGRVRFVGDAETRIKEDVLRLLRFFRFHAWYGLGLPDSQGLAACRKLAHLLPNLSGERVAAETLRLLGAEDPSPSFALMRQEGILTHFLAEAQNIPRLTALVALERGYRESDPLRRLAAVLDVSASGALNVARRLKLSNADTERLTGLAAPETPVTVTNDAKLRRREIYALGARRYRDLTLIAWAEAKAGSGGDDSLFSAMVAAAESWKTAELPVKGRDVLALGVENGPEVGRLLKKVEGWWIENDFAPDREACLTKLRRLVAN